MDSPRDLDIRVALRAELRDIHAHEPDTAIIDELSLRQGDARVDLAVVNGSLSGYEIKSDRDTLTRLPRQLVVYETCFNTMTIVVGSRHVDGCFEGVPETWGIWEAIPCVAGLKFEVRRYAMINPQIDAKSVVQLLWKDEALNSLAELGIRLNANLTRRDLWEHLVASVSADELFKIVRERLRARGDWRSGPTPFRGGGLSRSASKSPRYRENRDWLLSARSQRLPD
jgi:hypothetical protein